MQGYRLVSPPQKTSDPIHLRLQDFQNRFLFVPPMCSKSQCFSRYPTRGTLKIDFFTLCFHFTENQTNPMGLSHLLGASILSRGHPLRIPSRGGSVIISVLIMNTIILLRRRGPPLKVDCLTTIIPKFLCGTLTLS